MKRAVAAARCPRCREPHRRLGSARPLSALRVAPARLARAVRRVPRRLALRRPGRGEWAVNEVLSHLADAEVALAFRLRKIAAEPRGVLVAWIRTAGPKAAAIDARRAAKRSPRSRPCGARIWPTWGGSALRRSASTADTRNTGGSRFPRCSRTGPITI